MISNAFYAMAILVAAGELAETAACGTLPFMEPLHALILGIVEGITEFLPVSSTGHLILTSKLLGLADTTFLKSFEIAIQLGAILAVAVLYHKTILRDRRAMLMTLVAFVPTGVLGLLLHDVVKRHLLGDERVVLWSLFLGGLALVLFERLHRESGKPTDLSAITWKQAMAIGCCQAVAMIPGVSRSAATVVGGLAMGLPRKTVVEFSFLLALPTMAAATGLDLAKSASSFVAADALALGIGFAAAFVTALAAVRFLLRYVATRTFAPFGWYRMAAAAAFALLVL
jgi:undecaprenyl-diphosphatase